jgi:hypothetical protein
MVWLKEMKEQEMSGTAEEVCFTANFAQTISCREHYCSKHIAILSIIISS